MPLIKLDATASTNDFLRDLLKETALDDFTVVWADYQHKGRGQRQKSWQSEPGKNLIISILKQHNNLPAQEQFRINSAVSLALVQTLSDLNIPSLSIKWPNDILSGDRKICGILIENSVKGAHLQHSIIGIGLNVNQEAFDGLPLATSLSQLTGKRYDRDVLLYQLLTHLKTELSDTEEKKTVGLGDRYENYLYKRGKKVSFTHADGGFDAVVHGVTETGELQLRQDDGGIQVFDKGEIRWIIEAV